MDVIDTYRTAKLTSDIVIDAICKAFLLGAGGYEGSFDAAHTLDRGGLALLLQYLGLTDIDTRPSTEIDLATFEAAVRTAVDYGMSYDDIDDALSKSSISDSVIIGADPLAGGLIGRFISRIDKV